MERNTHRHSNNRNRIHSTTLHTNILAIHNRNTICGHRNSSMERSSDIIPVRDRRSDKDGRQSIRKLCLIRKDGRPIIIHRKRSDSVLSGNKDADDRDRSNDTSVQQHRLLLHKTRKNNNKENSKRKDKKNQFLRQRNPKDLKQKKQQS